METTAVVDSSKRALSFDRTLSPVLEIDPGAIVTFETDDLVMTRLAGGETMRDLGADATNAVTGPVSVRGAEPGDGLRIDVLDIQIERAWSVWLPGFGRLGARSKACECVSPTISPCPMSQ
jgi:amidase